MRTMIDVRNPVNYSVTGEREIHPSRIRMAIVPRAPFDWITGERVRFDYETSTFNN